MVPKFRPQRPKSPSKLDEASTLAPATPDVLLTQLAEANERQRVLFQELQHRVANTLHSMAGTLEIARRKIDRAPAEASSILERAMRRVSLLSDMHRCLNSPALLDRGISSILSHAVATAIDSHSTHISFQVDELDLSFDQMSIITMIVIEIANNAQKHVFAHNLGGHFLVSFGAVPDNHAVLSMKDDGPGWSRDHTVYAGRTFGLTILEGLADQLRGTLHIRSEKGTETSVVFPLFTQGALCQSQTGSAQQPIGCSSSLPSGRVAFWTDTTLVRLGATSTISPSPG
jgi:two-component sensor histidine kinase